MVVGEMVEKECGLIIQINQILILMINHHHNMVVGEMKGERYFSFLWLLFFYVDRSSSLSSSHNQPSHSHERVGGGEEGGEFEMNLIEDLCSAGFDEMRDGWWDGWWDGRSWDSYGMMVDHEMVDCDGKMRWDGEW